MILIEEDQKRIYTPWSYSIIIKIFKTNINYVYLKKKLALLWRITEEFILIDLGNDYLIVKLYKEKTHKILQQGPWFVNGFFLSVNRWQPNFVISESNETTFAIWLRLSKLPAEFYNHRILAKVGNKLG